MKRFLCQSLAIAFFGLFHTPTQAQNATETPQFHFPLEVGNVWVYSYRTPAPGSSCFISGCDYQRWEVVSAETSPEKGTCATISANQIYLWSEQSTFELCMNDNQLIRYPASDRGWPILNGTEESELLADFNMPEGGAWLTGTKYSASTDLWRELYGRYGDRFEIRAFFLLDNEEKETAYAGGHIANHSYDHGKGFNSHGFYETSNYIDLTGSFLNGVLSGDTTFVYTTSIDDVHHPERSEGPALLGNYPNPFNPSTVISYRLSVFGEVSISVLNLLGQRVATLFDGVQVPGQHSVTFDAAGLPSGMYVIILESAGIRDVRKITLLK
jgi:hypothetical protein